MTQAAQANSSSAFVLEHIQLVHLLILILLMLVLCHAMDDVVTAAGHCLLDVSLADGSHNTTTSNASAMRR